MAARRFIVEYMYVCYFEGKSILHSDTIRVTHKLSILFYHIWNNEERAKL